jgi:hypothetical protein
MVASRYDVSSPRLEFVNVGTAALKGGPCGRFYGERRRGGDKG